MTKKLAVLMDPIQFIHIKKDSTFALLLEAQRRHWQIYYFEQQDLLLKDGAVSAQLKPLKVFDDAERWFAFGKAQQHVLTEFDVIFMRKDPPVDMEYIYTTQLLELAEQAGVLVLNKPQSLRDFNEKLFISWFPECCAPTLISKDLQMLKEFHRAQGQIICKPLAGMGGAGIFHLQKADTNANVVFETLTENGQHFMLVQRYIPEIVQGDKRILLINGEPLPFALARIPAKGESRGNLAAGGTGVGVELSERDRFICDQVGPVLREKGLWFVGIDVIGNYLTEINITSPTCIRQLDQINATNISAKLLDEVEVLLKRSS